MFRLGGEGEAVPDWPARSDRVLGILIERTGEERQHGEFAWIGFLVPDLVRPVLYEGAEVLVPAGPKVVGDRPRGRSRRLRG